jgi:hypothetical protein
MPLQGIETLTTVHLPQPHGLIIAPASENAAIEVEGY